MNPQSFPKAVASNPWIAFIAIILFTCAPAFNTTVAEWMDLVDSSKTTAWQPELVIDAWADAIRTICIGIYAYLTRSGTSEREAP